MSHIIHHPNHRQAASFREESYCSSNHNRLTHHNRADFREEEDYYYASKVEAPVRYEEAVCSAERVYGRPSYGKYCEDKVVDYEFTETIREDDILVDDCGERKHHGRFNRARAF